MIKSSVIQFFQSQHFIIASTIDRKGYPHNSCKGVVDIDKNGKIYLLDLYVGKTYENLKKNSYISITAVDEHKFEGYCFKGKAKRMPRNKVNKRISKLWDDKIISRISHRLLKNMRGEKGRKIHPEALLPGPTYLIEVHVEEIIDLLPGHIKRKA